MARRTPEAVPRRVIQGLERLESSVDAHLAAQPFLLLEVSRINSGGLSLEAAQADLPALVRKVTVGTIPAAERAGCRVRLTVPEGIAGMCDATAVERIL